MTREHDHILEFASNCRMRIEFVGLRGRIQAFVVQLEVFDDEQ